MRRSMVFVLFAALTLLVAGSVATAEDHDHEFPEHPHILVLDAELSPPGPPGPDTVLVGFRKCIDLAANQALPLGSQHHNVHFGTAGQMLFTHAGHVVAPTVPFPDVPWEDCESFADFWGIES